MTNESQTFKRCVVEETLTADVANITDYLVSKTGLPKGRIKHALNCGALRIKKKKGGFQRLRRATASALAGNSISFHYDEHLLALKPAAAELLQDMQQYSIWFKPPGVLAQGTEWGDHCSLLRLAEMHFGNQRTVFLVHRLDRDACGLMLVAHSGEMADKLTQLFVSRAMEKQYLVRVDGNVKQDELVIEQPLDGKAAVTHLKVKERNLVSSLLEVRIETGRKHQIRRHLASIGHPVTGDTQYGEKSASGLHLAAVRLQYSCPVQGRIIEVSIDPQKIHKYWH